MNLLGCLVCLMLVIVILQIGSRKRKYEKFSNQYSNPQLSQNVQFRCKNREQSNQLISGKGHCYAQPSEQSDVINLIKRICKEEIKPTFKHFADTFKSNPDLCKAHRLATQSNMSNDERNMILDILQRIQDFNENNITTTPHRDLKMGDTSYTIAKKDIYMCLVDINGEIHPIDHILFAFVHELAHVANRTEQHDDQFWTVFRFMSQIVCQYDCPFNKNLRTLNFCYTNFKNKPYLYCLNNIKVEYNPIFDPDTYIKF